MKPCLFVFCSVQRESLLQRWKRQVQRHGSVLGIRHEERCLPGVSGKCRFLVLIDFSFFLLLNYCRIHIHTCQVGKLFLPLWCVHACHVGMWEHHEHQKEVVLHFIPQSDTLTAVSCLWVTMKSREKVTLTLQNVTDKSFPPSTRCLLSSDVNLCSKFFCFSFSGCCPGLRAVH